MLTDNYAVDPLTLRTKLTITKVGRHFIICSYHYQIFLYRIVTIPLVSCKENEHLQLFKRRTQHAFDCHGPVIPLVVEGFTLGCLTSDTLIKLLID